MKRVGILFVVLFLLTSCAGGGSPENPSISTKNEKQKVVTSGCSGQKSAADEDISSDDQASMNESLPYSYIVELKEKLLANEVQLPTDFKPAEGADINLELVAEYQPNTLRCTLLSLSGTVNLWAILFDKNGEISPFLIGDNLLNAPTIYSADIDADNTDEIILQCELDGSGSTGPYFRSLVLKFDGDEACAIYDSENETQWVDLGFRFAFLNQYQGVAKNVITDKKVVIDTSEYLFYDDRGQIEDPLSILEDGKFFTNSINSIKNKNNFLIFKPQDIDGDGIDEILVREDFFIDYQFARRVGCCYAVLQYDSKGFSIKDSNFVDTFDPNQTEFDENWSWVEMG